MLSPFAPRVILGPPGTGKTRALLEYLDLELERGVAPSEIAFQTFTRAARLEALSRVGAKFGLDADACPYFRTIHSTAFRLLGLKHDRVMTQRCWAEFGKLHGYEFSKRREDKSDPAEVHGLTEGNTADDLLRYAYEWGRNRRLASEETLARCPAEGVHAAQFLLFVDRLQTFKCDHRLLDYSDFLEEVLRRKLAPPVAIGFVDEAQDLSPLQIAVIESWLGPCDRSYVAGDDDQAIYEFQGANPRWLGELASRTEPVILGESYRIPDRVHSLANAIIRQNRSRVPKEYRPRGERGEVLQLDRARALDLIDGTRPTLVLARNRYALKSYAAGLMERGVPFLVEGSGGYSPLSSARLVAAAEIAIRMHKDPSTPPRIADLDALLAFIPTDGDVVPRGLKSQVKKARPRAFMFRGPVLPPDIDLEPLHDFMHKHGPIAVLGTASASVRRYLQVMFDRYGCIPDPQVRLTSIHASKGREADLVVVIPDMAQATWRAFKNGGVEGRESENRVFYVGVTRARHTLVLVDPRRRRHFEFPRVVEEGADV